MAKLWHTLRQHVSWVVVGAVAAAIVGVNFLAHRDLPDDPLERILRLQQTGHFASAEAIYVELLAEDPLDLELHRGYIGNHFEIAGADRAAIRAYYADLAASPGSADVGYYGLGLIHVREEDYPRALEAYYQVEDQDQAYLNNSIGYVYLKQDRNGLAEPYFHREIGLGGNVSGAVENLVTLYQEEGRWEDLQALLEGGKTAPYVGLRARRRLTFHQAQVGRYLRLAFLAPLGHIAITAGLSALLICGMWFLYFWRIDVFEQEPLSLSVGVLLAGGLMALFSSFPSDILAAVHPITLGQGAGSDFVFSLVHIGLVEELVKFLPVVLVVWLSRQDTEPIDLMIYGALSALGFATLENGLYFTGYGLDIVFVRFLISTVLHLAMTGVVCYAWAWARYMRGGLALPAVLGGFGLAVVAHGLFDYFLLCPQVEDLAIASYGIQILLAIAYGRMLRTGLNLSPYFDGRRSTSRRLANLDLLVSTAVVLLLIAFLYNNFTFSTQIANQKLFGVGVVLIVDVILVFGALGTLTLTQGKLLPLWRRS